MIIAIMRFWFFVGGFVVFSGNMLRGCAAGVKEFVPADEQGGGWTAVAGARLDYWLVGWC